MEIIWADDLPEYYIKKVKLQNSCLDPFICEAFEKCTYFYVTCSEKIETGKVVSEKNEVNDGRRENSRKISVQWYESSR